MKTELMNRIFERAVSAADRSWELNTEAFDWNPGVFLAGAEQAYQKTGNEGILHYLKDWTDRHLGEAELLPTVNSSAPFVMISGLYAVTGEEKYRAACEKSAQWLTRQAPLTVDGGLEHTVTEGNRFGDQMWADTLFMAVLFLGRWGNLTGNVHYLDFAKKQLLAHYQWLRDPETGLFFHGWDGRRRNHMSASKWARANAWVILASCLILQELPGYFEGKDFILSSLNELAEVLKNCQHENGGFSTVLDRPESYCEASATAGIAAGLYYGISQRLLSEEYLDMARKAEAFVEGVTKPDGSVMEVSTGTPIMPSVEAYFTIDRGCTLYGQGLALFMLAYEM